MGGAMGKSGGSWDVDHSYDHLAMTNLRDSISTIASSKPGRGDSDPPGYTDSMETPAERKARKRSHIVAYTTMFVMSIGFSIVLSGVWPYLEELKPGIEKSKLGAVVAANPLGQMVASPLLGLWGNKMGSVRIPCLVTVVFFILGNAMYAFLAVFGDAAYWMMLVSRFVVGVSSANVALCRSYLAESTTLKERTVGIAIIAAAQALGFVVGPGIQTVLTLLIPDPIDTGSDIFILDKYTTAGWVASALGFINLVILMPGIFEEHTIADKERALMNKKTVTPVKLPKPDAVALTGVLFGFFVTLFIYVLIETLATPFVMDQYGWGEDYAVIVIGIALSGGGFLSMFMFVASSVLAKKYDERKIIFILGFLPMIVGTILYIPFTGEPMVIQEQCYDNISLTTEMSTLEPTAANLEFIDPGKSFPGGPLSLLDKLIPGANYFNDYSLLKEVNNINYTCSDEYQCACGCPLDDQPWCDNVKALPIPQIITAFVITIMGYPVAQSLAQSLFSKIIGPRPQGLWMGVLTGVGSFSRILGPVFVSLVYTYYGTIITFGILSILMVIAGIELLIIYKRLVPIKQG